MEVSALPLHAMTFFEELIEASNHSTIQMIIFDESKVSQIGKVLEDLKCFVGGKSS